MKRLLISASLLFLVPPALFGGCSEDEPSVLSLLAGGCLLNSDCDEGLACVFERCHIECNDTSDCPVGEDGERLRCVVGEKPEHVCQLPDESKCSYHSQCPGEQICGPDGSCRDQCQDDRDCIDGQTCVAQGVCADPDELDDTGELSGEVPPPDQQTGFPCAYDSQCVGVLADPNRPDLEYVCRNGGCNFACFDDVDCDPEYACFPADDDRSTPGNCHFVGAQCVPNEQQDCICLGGAPGVQTCDETGMRFNPCTDYEGVDCAPT